MATSGGLQFEIAPPVLPALSQPSTIVPVHVSVHNPGTHAPVTLLNWGTPLDPRANLLGIFHIRDVSQDTLVPLDTIKVSRALPPSADDLVEIPPGGSVDVVVTLSHVPLVEGHEYSIQAQGTYHAVWEGSRNQVPTTELEKLSGGKRGEFSSNVASISVE